MKTPASSIELLHKADLIALCERLIKGESNAVEQCIAFMEAETKGLWHGRARAMMARRLKHCQLSPSQRSRLVGVIVDRLAGGQFSEQFKDQLRLVLHVAPEKVFTAARRCQGAAAEHIRRYAAWVLSHEPPTKSHRD